MLENLGGGKQEWVNDGFCDDMNNNRVCMFDGGDCCGVYANKRYCLECTCKSKFYFYNSYTIIACNSKIFVF